MLPDISVRVDIPPHEFLKRLEPIARRLEDADVRKGCDTVGFEGWGSLIIDPRSPSPHKKLSCMVYAKPDSDDRVFIDLIADRWTPDLPTYDTYVDAARSVFKPLVKVYNKEYQSRLRLSIQPNTVKKFMLPQKTAQRLQSFIVLANTSALHPLDWNRFYEFIAFCHAHHVKLSKDRLHRLLFEGGFDEEKAEHLSDIYRHGIGILALR